MVKSEASVVAAAPVAKVRFYCCIMNMPIRFAPEFVVGPCFPRPFFNACVCVFFLLFFFGTFFFFFFLGGGCFFKAFRVMEYIVWNNPAGFVFC